MPAAAAPAADTVSPMLEIDDMPQELTTTEVVLSGRVMDDRGEVELTVNGGRVSIEDKGEFVARQPLSPGRNALAFVAVDTAGNRTMKLVHVSAPLAGSSAGVPETAGVGSRVDPAAGVARASFPARYAERGDGTLVDIVTGISWTKRVAQVAGWKASKSYCKKLELGRHRDWILPNIEELEELYLSSAGILTFPGGMFWGSTRNGSGEAWTFEFTRGQRHSQPVAGAEGGDFKVFCLRRQRSHSDPPLQNPFAIGDSRLPGNWAGGPTTGQGIGGQGTGVQNTSGQSASGQKSGGGGHGGGGHGGGGHGGSGRHGGGGG